MDIEHVKGAVMRRRSAIKRTGGLALLLSQAALLEQVMTAPDRPAFAAAAFSDIQFDIGRFMLPNTYSGMNTYNDGGGPITAAFGPIYTVFTPIRLTRTPTKADQATLTSALAQIEANFDASPSGLLIVSLSYGLPYFNRLPAALVAANMPRLTQDTSRFVLENAVAGPTDVVGGVVQGVQNPPPKERFNVNVVLEQNDMLLQMRSDSIANLTSALAWLQGSNNLHGKVITSPAFNGLLAFQTTRVQFMQPGMPRSVADQAAASHPNFYEFHSRINPSSSMVMGFVDQQINSSAPNAATVTFVGDPANHNTQGLTTARAGDYFDNGSTVHFSHVIDDLYQFYLTPAQDPDGEGEPFTERVQYMFRSNQIGGGANFFGLPVQPNSDEFTNGGGPAFVANVFQGTGAAALGAQATDGQATVQANTDLNATFTGEQRLGHEAALQLTSRAADGTPLHIRMDGPGFDGMDVPAFQTFPDMPSISVPVPAGTSQFKLEFLIFVPTSEFFRQLRISAKPGPVRAVRGPRRRGRDIGRRPVLRQRPGTVPDRHPAAEPPHPAPPPPRLPPARAHLSGQPSKPYRALGRQPHPAAQGLPGAVPGRPGRSSRAASARRTGQPGPRPSRVNI